MWPLEVLMGTPARDHDSQRLHVFENKNKANQENKMSTCGS